MGSITIWKKRGGVERLSEQIKTAFFRVGQDIRRLQDWVAYLKTRQDLQEDSHIHHIKLTKTDIENLHRWIEYLDQHNTHFFEKVEEQQVQFLELKKSMSLLEERLLALEIQKARSSIITPSEPVRSFPESINKPIELISNHIRPISSKVHSVNTEYSLTPSESRVLDALFHYKKPITYEELSHNLDLNYGTVKNLISRIRKRGLDIKDKMNPAGEKEFYLLEKTKIEISGR